MKVSEWVAMLSAAVTLIGGGAWYVKTLEARVSTVEAANFESRVRTLEDRVHTLTTALSTANSAEKIAGACADYAHQLATGFVTENIGTSKLYEKDLERIRSAMAGLGLSCAEEVNSGRPDHVSRRASPRRWVRAHSSHAGSTT